MPSTVQDIMTRHLETVAPDAAVGEAARRMRDAGVGDVAVVEQERLVGLVTDRDIAVRIVAEGRDASTPVREACSAEALATAAPGMSQADAARLMREKAVRRLPVVEGDRIVGMVSIGDLAIEQDERSALADISATESNR